MAKGTGVRLALFVGSVVVSLAAVSLAGCLIASRAVNAQPRTPPSSCPNWDDATLSEHLNSALSDSAYGACIISFAAQQKTFCDSQPKPAENDIRAMAALRACLQLSITLQDLAVNFQPQPRSAYLRAVADCASSSGAGPPCEAKANIEKMMRCNVANAIGGSMDGCLPPIPSLPRKQ